MLPALGIVAYVISRTAVQSPTSIDAPQVAYQVAPWLCTDALIGAPPRMTDCGHCLRRVHDGVVDSLVGTAAAASGMYMRTTRMLLHVASSEWYMAGAVGIFVESGQRRSSCRSGAHW